MNKETKIIIKEYLAVFAIAVSALVAALSLAYIMWLFSSFIDTLNMEHKLEMAKVQKQIQQIQIN